MVKKEGLSQSSINHWDLFPKLRIELLLIFTVQIICCKFWFLPLLCFPIQNRRNILKWVSIGSFEGRYILFRYLGNLIIGALKSDPQLMDFLVSGLWSRIVIEKGILFLARFLSFFEQFLSRIIFAINIIWAIYFLLRYGLFIVWVENFECLV